MIAETVEAKFRSTRAVLRKDAPQAPDPNEQGGGERERIPHQIPLVIFKGNVRRGSSEPQPPARADDDTVGSDDGIGRHSPRDGMGSAHGPRHGRDSANGPLTTSPKFTKNEVRRTNATDAISQR